MCMDCGCARPMDDGSDHETVPGGYAESAIARSRFDTRTLMNAHTPSASPYSAVDADHDDSASPSTRKG